jgi:phosphatidylglycerophosphatase A
VQWLARAVATAGGVGYLPIAPGTAGSLLVVPVLPWVSSSYATGPGVTIAGVLVVVVVAVWAAGAAQRSFGTHDDGRVVVDEVAGMLVAGLFLPPSWAAAGLGFLAFRLFDVWKPPPIGWLDRHVAGGLGVVADDLLAGVYAGVVVRVLLEVA